MRIAQIAVLDMGNGEYQNLFFDQFGEKILHLALVGKAMPNN